MKSFTKEASCFLGIRAIWLNLFHETMKPVTTVCHVPNIVRYSWYLSALHRAQGWDWVSKVSCEKTHIPAKVKHTAHQLEPPARATTYPTSGALHHNHSPSPYYVGASVYLHRCMLHYFCRMVPFHLLRCFQSSPAAAAAVVVAS